MAKPPKKTRVIQTSWSGTLKLRETPRVATPQEHPGPLHEIRKRFDSPHADDPQEWPEALPGDFGVTTTMRSE